MSLEQALEFIREDECVEVTPASVRLRKLELDGSKRQSSQSKKARALADRRRLTERVVQARSRPTVQECPPCMDRKERRWKTARPSRFDSKAASIRN